MDRFDVVLWAGVLIDLLVTSLALLGASRLTRDDAGRAFLGLRALLLAIVATSAVFVVKLIPLGLAGLNPFGVIHLVYLDLAVVVPAVGLGVLVHAAWGRRRIAMAVSRWVVAVAALTLAGPPLAVYATFVEPFALQVEETVVPISTTSPGGEVCVAVLADLQFDHVTAHEHTAVAKAMAAAPDVIVIPGDVFQGSDQAFENELPAIRTLLEPLHAPGGVYLITGNMDTPERLRRLAAGTEMIVLSNRVVVSEAAGRLLAIGGVEDRHAATSLEAVADRLRTARAVGAWTILLAHRPDVALELDSGRGIDLMIAGHTHGGQVQIPGWGPVIKLSRTPRAVAGGGLHSCNGLWLYVSRGVGWERGQAPRLRFACPPEVSVLRLRGSGSG